MKLKLANLSNCDHLGVCAMNSACPSHATCQQAAQACKRADPTPTSVDGMFNLCEAALLGIAFAAGMLMGGLVVGYFEPELRAICWAVLSRG